MAAHRKLNVFVRQHRLRSYSVIIFWEVSLLQNKPRKQFIIPHRHRSQWSLAHAAITRRMRVFSISGSSPKNGSEPCVFAVPMSAA